MYMQVLSNSIILSHLLSDSLSADTCLSLSLDPLIGETENSIMMFAGNDGFLMSESTNSWYFYFFMLLFVGYALARAFLGRLLSSTFTAAIRYGNAQSMFNDNSQLQRQRDNVLYAFYFLSTGFFLMILAGKLQIIPYELAGFNLFAFFTGLIISVFYGKIILVNLAGQIFFTLPLLRKNLYIGYSFNKLIGIVLLPLNFAIVFTNGFLHEILIYFSGFFLLVMIIMKIIRGILFSLRHNVFNFYLFLYLCALEIVPLLLLYKWFVIIA